MAVDEPDRHAAASPFGGSLAACERPLLGVLAGGRGSRLGGCDKAWLRAPSGDEALLPRLLRLGRELALDAVVVGGRAPSGVVRLSDDPSGIGPIGGLCALLAHAGERPVLALACDLPYVTVALLGRLALSRTQAAVLAPRDPESGKWQPLFARYDPVRALPALRRAVAAGERSLQPLLRALEVEELALSAQERAALRDWDEPADLPR